MVAGYSRLLGLCVVTPISMDPDHLSTSLSMRIWGHDEMGKRETKEHKNRKALFQASQHPDQQFQES